MTPAVTLFTRRGSASSAVKYEDHTSSIPAVLRLVLGREDNAYAVGEVRRFSGSCRLLDIL